jgi:hypothetical protein
MVRAWKLLLDLLADVGSTCTQDSDDAVWFEPQGAERGTSHLLTAILTLGRLGSDIHLHLTLTPHAR